MTPEVPPPPPPPPPPKTLFGGLFKTNVLRRTKRAKSVPENIHHSARDKGEEEYWGTLCDKGELEYWGTLCDKGEEDWRKCCYTVMVRRIVGHTL